MGDSGSQVLGFTLARARPRLELDGRRLDRRDAPAADPRARGADPRHDARHRRAPARRAAGHAGRPRPHVAPARLPGAVGQARGRPARRRLRRARLTSLAYKVLDDTRITLAGVLSRSPSCSSSAATSPTSNARRAPDGRGSFMRSLLVHRRRFVEVLVDFALITASFTVAYIIRVEGRARPGSGTSSTSRCRRSSSRATSSSSLFGLYRGVWRYAGARDAASIFAAVARLGGRRVPLHLGDRAVERLPARHLPHRPPRSARC